MSETNTGIGPDGTVGTGTAGAQKPSAARAELERLGLHDAVELARGGFGVVYKAFQPSLNRAVAVKVMTTEVRDEITRVRFERECKAMGMLSDHPSIVTVFDAGFTHHGRPYIVMDLMTNGALSDQLERNQPYRWRAVLEITVKVAGALGTAHKAGILHRDIKPENIMMSEYGEPKLGDFGIARLQGGPETRTGTLTASIAHVAPELLSGEPPSVRTDLYALGSTMYSLLTGEPAFLRPTDESIVPALSRITNEPVPDLRPHGVPDPVCRLIDRLMAKDPAERFASAEEAAQAMQQLQRSMGVPVTTLRIPDLPAGAQLPPADTGPTGAVGVLPPPPAPTANAGQAAPTTEVSHGPAQAAPTEQTDVAGWTEPVHSPGQAPTPERPPPAARRRPTVLIAGVLVVVLAAAAVAFALTRGGDTPTQAEQQPGGPDSADEGEDANEPAPLGAPIDTGQFGRQVSDIRGVAVREPVEAFRLDRASYDARIREWSIADREDDLATQGRVLTALHLLPEDTDLVAFTQDLYAEQFLGFYDQRTRQIFLRAETPALSALERSIVVDETISALLDQNFDITAQHEASTNPDADRALTTVVKGDTFLSAAVWAERFLTADEQEQRSADLSLLPDQVARAAPEAVRADLVFPFVAGEQFVRAMFDEGGVEALNDVYANPPTTTEQVLHPNKYLDGEPAADVSVDAEPGDGWEEVVTRPFGEFDVQMLTAALGTEVSEAAGAGWGGGELKAWTRGEETAVAVSLAFDTPAEAEEGCDAVRRWYRQTAGGSAQGGGLFATDRDVLRLRCRGAGVDFSVAPDEAIARRLV